MKEKFSLIDYNNVVEDFTQYDFSVKELVCFKCHECCCYDSAEAKRCDLKSCPLYPLKAKWYKIPRRRRQLTEEERKKRSETMKQTMSKYLENKRNQS